jgi:hypothetical protein
VFKCVFSSSHSLTFDLSAIGHLIHSTPPIEGLVTMCVLAVYDNGNDRDYMFDTFC